MCGYEPFDLYDYLLDRQTADDMGFETVEELYERISDERLKTYDGQRACNGPDWQYWNARFEIIQKSKSRNDKTYEGRIDENS